MYVAQFYSNYTFMGMLTTPPLISESLVQYFKLTDMTEMVNSTCQSPFKTL